MNLIEEQNLWRTSMVNLLGVAKATPLGKRCLKLQISLESRHLSHRRRTPPDVAFNLSSADL